MKNIKEKSHSSYWLGDFWDDKAISKTLKSNDLDYSYEGDEEMNCNYDGDDMKIAFNAKF